MAQRNIWIQLRDILTHPWFTHLAFLVGFVGIYYSRALVSIFDVSIFILGLIHLTGCNDIYKRIWNKNTTPFIGLFIIYLISALTSEDIGTGLKRLKTNNYFLLIPLGISMLQPINRERIGKIVFSFLVISSLTAIIVLLDYLLLNSSTSEDYKVGKTMRTPIIHIQYSYYVSMACVSGIWLMTTKLNLFQNWRKWNICFTIFLFGFLHLLAVRTGLVALYSGLLLFALFKAHKYLNKKQIIVAIAGALITLFLAVNFIPSLKNKIQYMRYDIKLFVEGKGSHEYSDNLRLISLQNGLRLLKENPIFGTGIGDLQNEIREIYEQHNPEVPIEKRFPPINQFLYSASAFGWVGGAIFFLVLLTPLLLAKSPSQEGLLLLYGATLGSFLGDFSIELQLGKVVFTTAVALLMWYGSEPSSAHQSS